METKETKDRKQFNSKIERKDNVSQTKEGQCAPVPAESPSSPAALNNLYFHWTLVSRSSIVFGARVHCFVASQKDPFLCCTIEFDRSNVRFALIRYPSISKSFQISFLYMNV